MALTIVWGFEPPEREPRRAMPSKVLPPRIFPANQPAKQRAARAENMRLVEENRERQAAGDVSIGQSIEARLPRFGDWLTEKRSQLSQALMGVKPSDPSFTTNSTMVWAQNELLEELQALWDAGQSGQVPVELTDAEERDAT